MVNTKYKELNNQIEFPHRNKITVIVSIYNVETYVEKSIQSIQNQTYENLEIILVDDGSTDQSGKICDEYAKMDSRIKVLHKTNGGLSSARNAGVAAATGTYIIFSFILFNSEKNEPRKRRQRRGRFRYRSTSPPPYGIHPRSPTSRTAFIHK